ncbi:MAG: DNA repair protein RecN [Candidatus Zixiibacteriota bacterium]
MLTTLTIENVALVEKAELKFEPGLSVLTGETGAGKSVVVTALAIALGDRADREFVRHGAKSATVTAYFESNPDQYNSDGRLEVYREILANGSSKTRINGKPASLTHLRQITAPFAEILGQHANQMLMNEDNHLAFLDRFAALEPLRDEVALLFTEWQKVVTELRRVKNQSEQLAKERELLLFQKNEIEKAHVQVGEEEELLGERKILDSARTLMSSAAAIQQILDADDVSVTSLLSLGRKELEQMAAIDVSLQEKVEMLSEIEFQIDDLRRFMEQYGSSIPDDPQRIEVINLRLDEIYNLKKKYGGSEEAVLKTLQTINDKLRNRPDIDLYIADLEKESERLYKGYTEKANALSKARQDASHYLRKLVINELNELAIDNCRFEFEFLYEDDPDGILIDGRAVKPFAHGFERGRFLFSANPGEQLRSLVKTASGGEISRILLALKSAEKKHRRLSPALLVFDEVDAGIGGKTAVEVGKKLKKLAQDCQVLVVTHLHQIARQADHHYVAEKSSDRNNRTTISVRKLNKNEIPGELDRMVALPSEAQR